MMTIEQRIELLRGGYTPEQIEKFDQLEQVQPAQQGQQVQQEPKQEQIPAAAPAAEPDPAAAPAAEPDPAAAPAQQEPDALQLIRNMIESSKETNKNIAQLTAAIQANALASSGLPGGANNPTAEEALASIIAPKPKERG